MAASLAFLLSYCSFGYQQLLALALFDGTGNFVGAQAGAFAIFLLGLGLGSFGAGRGALTWFRLIRIEWFLSLLGACAIPYVHGCEIGLRMWFGSTSMPIYILAVTPYIFLIGVLTGAELPLLLSLQPKAKPGSLLAAHYAGALVAALTVPGWLFTHFDLAGTGLALSLINFAAGTVLVIRERTLFRLLIHGALAGFVFLCIQVSEHLSDLHLKGVYFTPTLSAQVGLGDSLSIFSLLGSPIRMRTKYQWIDILPPEFSESVQGRQDFQLYLDRRLQLSSGAVARYHQSFVHGAVNLSGRKPTQVLILGGGDGLLAKELLTYQNLQRVDLVELDSEMIHLARTQRDLRHYNGGSLEDPRVHVHIDDAFQFVRRAKDLYDLILIDLPFPVSYELSLLFSKEFYALARTRLQPQGLMALDFPLPGGNNTDLPVLVNTLKAAGWISPYAFGVEDFFIAARRDDQPLQFHYESLFPVVEDQTLRNLISRTRDLQQTSNSSVRVNTVLFPYLFQSGLDERIQNESIRPDLLIRQSENPGFLPLFLIRFQKAWTRLTGYTPPPWPIAVNDFRDFAEAVPTGELWPRYQWGLEVKAGAVQAVYQWTDVRHSDRLRARWKKQFSHNDDSLWFSVAWTANLNRIEYFYMRNGKIFVRPYIHRKLGREVPLEDYMQTKPVGLIPPDLENRQATILQNNIQKNFLIYPRSLSVARDGSWKRIYFP